MITIVRQRRIGAPVRDLWTLLDDVELWPQWFSFAESAETLEGTGVGRRQRIHGHWGKRHSEVDLRVTGYKPESFMSWTHEQERLDGRPAPLFASSTDFVVRLEPYGRDTVVTLESHQQPASALKGVAMRLFGTREVGRTMDRSLDRLERTAASR